MAMSDTVIRVENLSKYYRLGELGRPDSLREAMSEGMGRLMGRLSGKKNQTNANKDFWALDDVSFDIHQGDVVGIIGHNGAGKSTLLKILSRITAPTRGKADIWGRVGSLLEVGTGFHPELTGRENIFLNGAILGMTPSEIKSKFDEIVAFSEVEQFLETPVKRYSSGMYVRLAFAVAAHLQPEILIVDEVLAVGDVKFQNKCLGKMKDVANSGRTVLFVSHNMGAVQSMCTRGIVLKAGKIITDGTAAEAVTGYLKHMNETATTALSQRTDRKGDGKIRVDSVVVSSNTGKPPNTVATGEKVTFEVTVSQAVHEMNCLLILVDHFGQRIMALRNCPEGNKDEVDPQLGNRLICEVDDFPLAPGEYHINLELWSQRYLHDNVESATVLTVVGGMVQGRLVRERVRGAGVVPLQRWSLPK